MPDCELSTLIAELETLRLLFKAGFVTLVVLSAFIVLMLGLGIISRKASLRAKEAGG